MNAAVPTTWTTGSTAAIKTGTWRAALPQHIRAPSPCHVACPMGGEIASWIGRARAGDLRGAFNILSRHNPFPAVTGRVCHHPCEAACNRADYDQPLAICRLERMIGDEALAQRWQFPQVQLERHERVAVVGSGPAGLSAAYQLRRLGYGVSLYESQHQLGGLLRHGIPPYRLARTVLDGEIGRILALGIELHCGQALATAAQLERLRSEHDAVFLALGAARPRRLAQLDHTQAWVTQGADYLAQASAGARPLLGRRVTVIGGGSAALDAARTARRAGHEVTIIALETVAQMPAQHEEITETLEEGINLIAGAMLNAATATDAGIRLECQRVRFQALAERGQFTLTPLADTSFVVMTDVVMPSIGQDPELTALQPGLQTAGALLKVDAQQATSLEGVWAGGDMASTARFVSVAIGMGQRAAQQIDRTLRGADVEAATPAEGVVTLAHVNTFYHPRQPRVREPRLALAQRLAGHAEVQLGLDLDQALAEARRCFSCGECTQCDNCVVYCPDLAVKRADGRYAVLGDYCKGCGVCVKECPTGSMKMVQEMR